MGYADRFRDDFTPVGWLMTIVAMALSWAKWHSVIWALVNGACGTFYVIYYIFKYL